MSQSLKTPREEARFHAVWRIYRWLGIGLVIAYGVSGIAVISPGEVGVIRRFGRWTKSNEKVTICQPGLVLAWPAPIDRVFHVPIKREVVVELEAILKPMQQGTEDSSSSERRRYAVTGDHNLIEVKASFRYRIEQPERYLTSLQDPEVTMERVVQTAISATISSWSIDEALRLQRSVSYWDEAIKLGLQREYSASFDPALWNLRTVHHCSETEFEQTLRRHLLDATESAPLGEILDRVRRSESLNEAVLNEAQRRLELLDVGARLTSLEFREIQPPAVVRDSFLAVHDARVEQEAWHQEARGEQSESLIEAETTAQQTIADARGKLVSRTTQANAEAILYEADLHAFQGELGDDVLRRLKQEAWEQILSQRVRVYAVSPNLPVGALHLMLPEVETDR